MPPDARTGILCVCDALAETFDVRSLLDPSPRDAELQEELQLLFGQILSPHQLIDKGPIGDFSSVVSFDSLDHEGKLLIILHSLAAGVNNLPKKVGLQSHVSSTESKDLGFSPHPLAPTLAHVATLVHTFSVGWLTGFRQGARLKTKQETREERRIRKTPFREAEQD